MSADQGRTTTPFSELRANLSPEAQERAAARTQEIVSQMDPVVDGGRDHAINAALDAAEALQERVAALEAAARALLDAPWGFMPPPEADALRALLDAPRPTATEEPTTRTTAGDEEGPLE